MNRILENKSILDALKLTNKYILCVAVDWFIYGMFHNDGICFGEHSSMFF